MIYNAIYHFIRIVLYIFYKIFFFATVKGLENIPENTGFIISGNHKSNHDAPFTVAYMPKRMKFLAKRELFSCKLFNWFLVGIGVVPITRGEISEISALKTILKLLKDGSIVSIFPEGTRHCTNIEEVKSGAVLFAIKAQVPILPVSIIGDYKLFHRMKIVFNKPIYYTEYYNTKVSQQQLHELSVQLLKGIYDTVADGGKA